MLYPKRLDTEDLGRVCTCTRGAVTVQSQPEDVLFYAQQQKKSLEKLLELPDIKSKSEVLSKKALEDSVNNTFSVSYVGKIDYGSLNEHIKNVHNYTDGSTYKTLFIEISSFGEWFYITVLQGFSDDTYYKAMLKILAQNGIEYIEEGAVLPDTPKIDLPY